MFIVIPHNKKELLQTPPPPPEGFPTTRGTEDKPGKLIQALIPAHDKLFYYREYGAKLQNILMFITVLILVLLIATADFFIHLHGDYSRSIEYFTSHLQQFSTSLVIPQVQMFRRISIKHCR